MTDELIATGEAARILDLSPGRVYQLAVAGALPIAAKNRNGRVFRRADVEALARQRNSAAHQRTSKLPAS